MTPDHREHALALLRTEPTRSLPLTELRGRLTTPGAAPPGLHCLALEFAGDERFRLLPPSPSVCELPAAYAPLLEATGVAVEPRVVLAEACEEETVPGPIAATRAALLAALARDAALEAHLSAAYGALEELGVRLSAVTDGAAAPSTTPPPALRARARSGRRGRRRA